MKRKWLKMAVTAAAVIGIAGMAKAVPISGDITFAGGVQLDSSSAGTATEVIQWTGPGGTGMPIVISDSGSFASVSPGTQVTFASPWFFNSGAVSSLWSVGGFTFNLTSSHIIFQGGNPAGVLVDGTGTVTGNGDSASMTWSFTTQDPGAAGSSSSIFSFSAASGTTTGGGGSVPDGGTTAMLLGLSILGLGLLRKQMFA